jgi:shikimate kinase
MSTGEVRAVFLTGFMGSGKSTVGRELARRLNWEFVDMDALIESRERSTIPEIFRDKGEPGFRLAETKVLSETLTSLSQNTVVALGGGAFSSEQNREMLRAWPSVFLEAPIDDLWQRCHMDAMERPLRTDRARFSQLYEERLSGYRQAALTVATANKDLASICIEIERALRLRRENNKRFVPTQSAGSETGGLP